MKNILLILLILSARTYNSSAADISVKMTTSKVTLNGIPGHINLHLLDSSTNQILPDTTLFISGIQYMEGKRQINLDSVRFQQGESRLQNVIFSENGTAIIAIPALQWKGQIRVIPGWLSLLPPLLAILLALLARQVLVALFFGVWLGAALIFDYNPLTGFLYALTDYIALAAADPDKMAIIVFSLTLGGMIGVISKMGGAHGIVNILAPYASNSRRGQLATWLMGIFIFFDDYANTLIVGNTMRPLTDKLRISREKLSYLVDTTAAPVANIAIISTWIGFEIGLIGDSFQTLGISENPYLVFLKTIPYNFYPLFALMTSFCIAWFTRDFGPMLKAERRCYITGACLAPGANPISSLDDPEITAAETVQKRWYNGFIPIAVVIITTLSGLWFTGVASLKAGKTDLEALDFVQYVSLVVGDSDAYAVLMWASFLGSIVAIVLAITQRLLTLEKSISAWIGGVKAMMLAALILTMAWSIGTICQDLQTAEYIIRISEGFLSPHFIPLLSFVIAALISFATGTSWGVMAILMPIAIPIAYLVPQADPAITQIQQQGIFLSTIASVLSGATFGDHCSPISDTTIMSSMASGADHIDHVRTQLPYALLGGLLAMVVGYLPVGFGWPPIFMILTGLVVIMLIIRFLGTKVSSV
jgi:Na+/H+ antiporter NhaC